MKLYKHQDRCNCAGTRIRLAREKLNYSQEQLAAQLQLIGLSINQKAISRIETDIRVVPDYGLLHFAQRTDQKENARAKIYSDTA